jgi:multiple sugar transport system permease protein
MVIVGVRSGKTAVGFLIPHMAGFLVFTLLPVLETFLISLFKWNLINAPKFTGLGNYAHMLTRDGFFWQAMGNTAYYTAGSVVLIVAASLGAALLLNQKVRFRSLLRTLYFVPNVSSLVAVSLVWMWIYNSDFGLLNKLLAVFGVVPGPKWLASTTLAMPAVIVMSSWTQIGFFTVIFLAGLQGIPAHLYEAASLDGCRWWTRFTRITLPLLSPTTFFVLVICVINSFQVFEQTFVMTKGGPAFSTTTSVMYIYQQAFKFQEMGYASAVSWGLFICIFAVTVFQVRMQRRWVFYGA